MTAKHSSAGSSAGTSRAIDYAITDVADDPPETGDVFEQILLADSPSVDLTQVNQSEYLWTFARQGSVDVPTGERGGAVVTTATDSVNVTQRPRGLALRELTLNQANPWLGERFWNHLFGKKPSADLFFVSTALDGSGKSPFVWPISPDSAKYATVRVSEGDSYTWTLGYGAPIYGPDIIRGGLAVSILVSESKASVRRVGQALSTISDQFASKSDLITLIAGLAGPGGFTTAAALNVLDKATNIVGEILKLDPDRTVGAYQGVYSATGSWRSKLRQDAHGASIRLVEVLD